MTVPTDLPDYQSYGNWRAPDIAAETAWPLSAAHPFLVTGYVVNYASLMVNVFTAPADGMTVGIEFWTDNTATVNVGTFQYTLAASQALNVMLPALGNYCEILMSTTNPATTDVNIAVVPTSTAPSSPAYVQDQNFVTNADVSIPASTAVIEILPWVSAGEGHVFCKDITGSGKLLFQVITLTAAGAKSSILQEFDVPVTVAQVDLSVPAAPLGLLIDNTDTVAHTAGYYFGVDGRL